MQRRKLALIAILTLTVSIVTSLQVVDLVSANYYPPPSIEIFSPIPAPGVHPNASVPLNVRVNVLTGESDITFIRYSLDGKANVTLNRLTREDGVWYWTTTKGVIIQGTAFRTESSLDNLAEGQHTLTIYSHAADGKEMSQSREFTVDYDYVPPQPHFTGYMNQTATPTPTIAQTGIPQPTTNTDNFQPIKNHLLFIIIISVVVSLLAMALLFKKKSKDPVKLEGKGN